MASALTVPAGAGVLVSPTGKRTRILLVHTWKQILRLQRDTAAEGFMARFTCPTCQGPITMTVPSKTSPRLECHCTTWIGR